MNSSRIKSINEILILNAIISWVQIQRETLSFSESC